MIKTIENLNYSKADISFPSVCPICDHSIEPIYLHNNIFINNIVNKHIFFVFFKCPHCHNCFISSYDLFESGVDNSGYTVYSQRFLIQSCPSHFKEENFETCISTLSPSFVKIYNQSLAAEHYGLDEIAGIGYRKALEFLIKDFLIIHESKDANKVNSTALGCCIDTMIDNPQLKTAASRATWLGNDQTHYEQKYTDKDIKDLKKLIKLSVNWMEMIYLTDEAEEIEKK